MHLVYKQRYPRNDSFTRTLLHCYGTRRAWHCDQRARELQVRNVNTLRPHTHVSKILRY